MKTLIDPFHYPLEIDYDDDSNYSAFNEAEIAVEMKKMRIADV